MLVPLAITLLLLLVPLATLRLLYILPHNRLSGKRLNSRAPGTPTHLLVVLGSGGHTAEMFSLIRDLNTAKYSYRTYVVSSGDNFSADLARTFEQKLAAKVQDGIAASYGKFVVATVPRARKIHQSILTTPFSSLLCLLHCLKLLALGVAGVQVPSESNSEPPFSKSHMPAPHSTTPDLMLTNGPATGVIVVFGSLLLRFFGFIPIPSLLAARSTTDSGLERCRPGEMRTIYIESWARVKRLSLSGKILVWVVDRFIVQWEQLMSETKGRGEYLGVLID